MLQWAFAALHLLAFGIGFGAIIGRQRALKGPLDDAGLKHVFAADAGWGIAAVLWIVTGLARLFMGTEKPTDYYWGNHLFWTKIALFVLIVALEIVPMMTLARWRRQRARKEAIDVKAAPLLARISHIQMWLSVLMVLAASAMARGFGLASRSP
ncbi:MAG: DUF2214 family protein [Candidatus Eisenbacteria bacterium]|uniref:DUF2214 family protein n=1 Tax=Eiseniibacteriota bacterium TaxID=2212470 RepID=A0A849SDV7_UNCEI|nr:DUF2214 family protein [Candidatus Eisenbacteria bacterium]